VEYVNINKKYHLKSNLGKEMKFKSIEKNLHKVKNSVPILMHANGNKKNPMVQHVFHRVDRPIIEQRPSPIRNIKFSYT